MALDTDNVKILPMDIFIRFRINVMKPARKSMK